MKTIRLSDAANNAALAQEAADVIRDGGLVCLPCSGRYRILANLEDTDAVIQLMQAKGRVHTAPALVFVPGPETIPRVARDVDPRALRLAQRFWPGPLTIRVQPSDDLPDAVRKQLGGRKSRIGVRVPGDAFARAAIVAGGIPVLVSSANRERKSGESSPAQVSKTFGRQVDLFIDGGDLKPGPPSTVVDVIDGEIVIERAGAIDEATLRRAVD